MPSVEDTLFDLLRKYRFHVHEALQESSDGGEVYLVPQKCLHNLDDLNREALNIFLKYGKE